MGSDWSALVAFSGSISFCNRKSCLFDQPSNLSSLNHVGIESNVNPSTRIFGFDSCDPFVLLQYRLQPHGAGHAREALHGPGDARILRKSLFSRTQFQQRNAGATSGLSLDKRATTHHFFSPSQLVH